MNEQKNNRSGFSDRIISSVAKKTDIPRDNIAKKTSTDGSFVLAFSAKGNDLNKIINTAKELGAGYEHLKSTDQVFLTFPSNKGVDLANTQTKHRVLVRQKEEARSQFPLVR